MLPLKLNENTKDNGKCGSIKLVCLVFVHTLSVVMLVLIGDEI